MTILDKFGFQGSRRPLERAQSFALEQLISFHCASGDLRWSMVTLALRAVTAMWVLGQAQSVRVMRSLARRGQGCFAADLADADTMVAAGGR